LICEGLLIKKEDFFKMKKIVGIIGAALLASSIFAVDFSAGVRLQGSLFNFNDGAVTILEEHCENQFYQKPISFAISSDTAGGALKLSSVKGGADAVTTDAWSIWFKPVDSLKITVGRWSTNLNQEHIGWCNTDSGIETDGYALSLGLDSFSWDLFLASGNGKWFVTVPKEGDAAVAELYTKFQFGADFGTVNAMFNAINTFKDFRFGAGLNLAGLPVGLWFNVIGIYAAEDFQRIRVEADVSGSVDSLGYELFIAGGYHMNAAGVGAANAFTGVEGWHVGGTYGLADAEAFVGFYAKLSFPIGNLGGFVELKDSNVLAKDFNMTINPGFTANVGGCEIKAGINLTAAKNVVVDVPVEFAINF
jgi:hypothetical protein